MGVVSYTEHIMAKYQLMSIVINHSSTRYAVGIKYPTHRFVSGCGAYQQHKLAFSERSSSMRSKISYSFLFRKTFWEYWSVWFAINGSIWFNFPTISQRTAFAQPYLQMPFSATELRQGASSVYLPRTGAAARGNLLCKRHEFYCPQTQALPGSASRTRLLRHVEPAFQACTIAPHHTPHFGPPAM